MAKAVSACMLFVADVLSMRGLHSGLSHSATEVGAVCQSPLPLAALLVWRGLSLMFLVQGRHLLLSGPFLRLGPGSWPGAPRPTCVIQPLVPSCILLYLVTTGQTHNILSLFKSQSDNSDD